LTVSEEFAAFLAKYEPPIAALAKRALTKLRKLVPGAVELVYDNYNALVIGFGSTERASDAFLSIALYPRWVTLFFLNGKSLRDPKKLLKGSGVTVRHIVLESAEDLDRDDIRALIAQAVTKAKLTMGGRRRMVIKSISKKQRPRRPR
jgi:hypothetical protein